METIVVSRSEMIYMFGESCPCECLLESMHHYASNLPFIFWFDAVDGSLQNFFPNFWQAYRAYRLPYLIPNVTSFRSWKGLIFGGMGSEIYIFVPLTTGCATMCPKRVN